MSRQWVLAGPSRVGKTSLMRVFKGEPFEQKHSVTESVVYASKHVDYTSKIKNLPPQRLWDTSGVNHQSLVESYITRKNTIILLVVALEDTTEESEYLKWFYASIKDKFASVCLVVNKIDVAEKEKHNNILERALQFQNRLQEKFPHLTFIRDEPFLCTAKESSNVLAMFQEIAEMPDEQLQPTLQGVPPQVPVSVSKPHFNKIVLGFSALSLLSSLGSFTAFVLCSLGIIPLSGAAWLACVICAGVAGIGFSGLAVVAAYCAEPKENSDVDEGQKPVVSSGGSTSKMGPIGFVSSSLNEYAESKKCAVKDTLPLARLQGFVELNEDEESKKRAAEDTFPLVKLQSVLVPDESLRL